MGRSLVAPADHILDFFFFTFQDSFNSAITGVHNPANNFSFLSGSLGVDPEENPLYTPGYEYVCSCFFHVNPPYSPQALSLSGNKHSQKRLIQCNLFYILKLGTRPQGGESEGQYRTAEQEIAEIQYEPKHLTQRKSPLPLETMSQFAESVIPDESASGGRDPESSESDESRHSLLREEGACGYHAELNK